MGAISGLAGIYWAYSFAVWKTSSSCGGPADITLQLGTVKDDGFSSAPLYECLSDQLRTYPNNAVLYVSAMQDANTFSYTTFQCPSNDTARTGCTSAPPYSSCTRIIPSNAKCGACMKLGTVASFMFSRSVSNDFYGILFGSIGAGVLWILVQLRLRGWRFRNWRCVKVDLDAEAEAEAKAEERRRNAMRAQFAALEKGSSTSMDNPSHFGTNGGHNPTSSRDSSRQLCSGTTSLSGKRLPVTAV